MIFSPIDRAAWKMTKLMWRMKPTIKWKLIILTLLFKAILFQEKWLFKD